MVVAALIATTFVLVSAHGSGHKTGDPTTHPTTTHASTTATPPTTRSPAPVHGVGIQVVTWTNPNGLAVNPKPGGSARPRTLITEIWYPSLGGSPTEPTLGAKPDIARGPYPVIVFAHGFNTLPSTYTPLLFAWVRAGYVVVAPHFPDESATEIESLKPPSLAEDEIAESDLVNEPFDLAYVVSEVEAAAGGQSGTGASFLKGLADPGKLAMAGQSDGAQAVAALLYSSTYATTYASMPVHPVAVGLLSPSEIQVGYAGTYGPLTGGPAVLAVQSATDTCNLPQDAATLFQAIGGGWFLKLFDVAHFPPYVGIGPASAVVVSTTIAFFNYVFAPPSAPSTPITRSGDVSGISVVYTPGTTPVLPTLPVPSSLQRTVACGIPT